VRRGRERRPAPASDTIGVTAGISIGIGRVNGVMDGLAQNGNASKGPFSRGTKRLLLLLCLAKLWVASNTYAYNQQSNYSSKNSHSPSLSL
jgi:hypothetical protein